MTMIQWLLPRLALSSLFAVLAFFAFFESIYLRDQAAFFAANSGVENASSAIFVWMWAFRGFAVLLTFSCIAVFLRK